MVHGTLPKNYVAGCTVVSLDGVNLSTDGEGVDRIILASAESSTGM